MPEDFDLDDDDNDEVSDGDTITLTKAEHDDLRAKARKAKKADEATASATSAQRELLFIKAGVDTDTKLGKLLLKSYEGDLTIEAIKAEAVDVGLIEAIPDGPALTDEEKGSTDERADLARDAQVEPKEDPDPIGSALHVGQEALDRGANEEVAMGQTFRQLAARRENWQPLG